MDDLFIRYFLCPRSATCSLFTDISEPGAHRVIGTTVDYRFSVNATDADRTSPLAILKLRATSSPAP